MKETFCILFFSTVLWLPNLKSQTDCRGIQVIVNELVKANYFIGSEYKTGLTSEPLRKDSQYIRFQELKRCATESQLFELTHSSQNIICVFAWMSFLKIQPKTSLHFLLNEEALKKRKVTVFLNYCQGEVQKAIIDIMVEHFYEKLLEREVSLSSNEIVDFLNFKEKRSRERFIENSNSKDGRF